MKSNSNSFEDILEALLKQKQVLEDLRVENENLQRQLADLRAGRGIFIDILGERIPLAVSTEARTADAVSTGNKHTTNMMEDTAPVPSAVPATEQDAVQQETTIMQTVEADTTLQPTKVFAATAADPSLQATASIPGEVLQTSTRETPLPNADFLIEDVPESDSLFPPRELPTLLDDALLAEFSNAATRRVGNWSAPNTNGPITLNPDLNENEKAALRRELMGSYILE